VIKPFVGMFLLLFLMLMGLVYYHWHYPYISHHHHLDAMVRLTHFATPALSVGFDKPRDFHGADANPIYPEMPTTSRMEFVYVQ